MSFPKPTFFIPTLAVVLWVLYRFWRSKRRARTTVTATVPQTLAVPLDPTPDSPIQFGYKNSWLAIQAPTTEAVAEAAGISDLRPANWRTGILAASESGVFLTPPVSGWVLIVGYSLPDLDPDRRDDWESLLRPLAARFRQVCYFGTQRVVGYNAWAKFADGQLVRALAYVGERGEILVNEGTPTPEEITLNHKFSSLPPGPLEGSEDDYPPTPDEEDVLDMAAAWSVSTRELPDLAPNPSSGWVSRKWPVA